MESSLWKAFCVCGKTPGSGSCLWEAAPGSCLWEVRREAAGEKLPEGSCAGKLRGKLLVYVGGHLPGIAESCACVKLPRTARGKRPVCVDKHLPGSLETARGTFKGSACRCLDPLARRLVLCAEFPLRESPTPFGAIPRPATRI